MSAAGHAAFGGAHLTGPPAPGTPKPVVSPTGPAHPAALEATLAAGRGYRDLSDFERAAERFGAALALTRASGDVQAETDALNLQAGLASTLGDYPGALASFERALALTEVLALPDRKANILNNIGTLHTLLGNYPLALEKLKAAHDLLRRVAPGTRSAASNLISLGTLYQELGDDAEARTFFVQAGKVAAAADEPLMAAAALNNLANTDLGVGNWRSAAEHFGRALEITRRLGAREHELDNLDGLGQVYVALGDFSWAEATHLDVLRAARALGDREGERDALLNLGRDYLALSRPARALEVLHTGLSLAERTERQPLIYKAHELISRAYEQLGDVGSAFRHYRAFHEIKEAIFNEESEWQARKLTVQFDLERARHEAEAYRLRTEIIENAREEAEATVRERTRELEEAQLEIVTRLAVAAEYRDDDTGEHTRRVGRNAAAIAHALA